MARAFAARDVPGHGFVEVHEQGVAGLDQGLPVLEQIHLPVGVEPVGAVVLDRPQAFLLGTDHGQAGLDLAGEHPGQPQGPRALDHRAKGQGRQAGKRGQILAREFGGDDGAAKTKPGQLAQGHGIGDVAKRSGPEFQALGPGWEQACLPGRVDHEFLAAPADNGGNQAHEFAFLVRPDHRRQPPPDTGRPAQGQVVGALGGNPDPERAFFLAHVRMAPHADEQRLGP